MVYYVDHQLDDKGHLPETPGPFKTPHWNHWFTLLAMTCDGGYHGWLVGSVRQIQ